MLALVRMPLSLDRLLIIKEVLGVVRCLKVLIHGLMVMISVMMELLCHRVMVSLIFAVDQRLIQVHVVIFIVRVMRQLLVIIWVAFVVADLGFAHTVGLRKVMFYLQVVMIRYVARLFVD